MNVRLFIVISPVPLSCVSIFEYIVTHEIMLLQGEFLILSPYSLMRIRNAVDL